MHQHRRRGLPGGGFAVADHAKDATKGRARRPALLGAAVRDGVLLRRLVTATSSLALAAALGAFWSEGLLAHSGEARLVTVPAEAEPGQEVDVFGEDVEVDSAVRVELLAPSGPIAVGEGRSDAGGHVALTIVLPGSLVPRVYELRLTDEAGSTVRAFVEVVAPPGPDPAVVGVAAGLVGAALVGSLVLAKRAAGRRHR